MQIGTRSRMLIVLPAPAMGPGLQLCNSALMLHSTPAKGRRFGLNSSGFAFVFNHLLLRLAFLIVLNLFLYSRSTPL